MVVPTGNLTFVGNPFDFSLFFARQPEADLEFTEEELEQTTPTRSSSPMKPSKKSGGGRPFFWILLLILIGGAAYIALEPEQVTEWLTPLLGESTQQQSAKQQKAPPQPAVVPPSPAPTPSAGPPADLQAPAGGVPAPAPQVPAPAPPVQMAASPLFAEGQRVTVMGDPATPGEMIQLTLDPAGSKPGPAVRPGATLSILDGDLQPSGWVYSVRTDDGLKGWVQEKRLRMKF